MASPRPEGERTRELAGHLQDVDRRPDGSLVSADERARQINGRGRCEEPIAESPRTPDRPFTGEDYRQIREGTHLPTYPRHFITADQRARNPGGNSDDYRREVQATGYDIIADRSDPEQADKVFPGVRRGPIRPPSSE